MMDGFDKPISNSQLTRNLWDQLLDLARKPSLTLVTASRKSLYELLRSPESRTSDFWDIFDTKIHVGCFDEADFTAVLNSMSGWQFSDGAQTELWNASNGFPILLLGVLNSVIETGLEGIVSSTDIRAAGDTAFLSLRDKLDALWRDCASTSHDLFYRVNEEGSVARLGIPTTDATTLIGNGFVAEKANKLLRPNRLLAKYLKESSNGSNALIRLFGNPDNYMINMGGALERRIQQIDGLDEELHRYLLLGLGELPKHPKVFFANIRGIIDRCLELIWDAELPQKRIPSDWFAAWRYNGESRFEDWLTRFPQGGQRLRLLDLMTGTQKCDRRSKYVTKSTYVLANAAQGFGDFGQHQEGAPIDPGTAYSALHLCIELAAAITRELPSA
jgi:hypothetical protein